MTDARDLTGEFIAARAKLTPEHKRMLKAAGVPSSIFEVHGLIGIARVDVDGDRFDLSPAGSEMFIVPARVDPEIGPAEIDHPEPMGAVVYGDTVDMIAFDLDKPERFASLTGLAPCLGFALFGDTVATSVWKSPLGWLQARCRGICPLTRDPVELRAILMRLPGPIAAEDIEHGRELDRLLARPLPHPPIFVHKARPVAA